MRLLILLPDFALACAGPQKPSAEPRHPVEAVEAVDLNRFQGTWYEIATIPQAFQKPCVVVWSTYALRDDGQLNIVSTCRKGGLDGEELLLRGVARTVDRSHTSRLEVSFQGPFWEPRWIINLGADYEYTLLGNPDRGSLWVLSRTSVMSANTYRQVLERAAAQGYDVSKIKRTLQPGLSEGQRASLR